MMTARTRLMLAMLGIVTVLCTVLGVLVGLWAAQPSRPVKVIEYSLLNDEIEPGQPLRLKIIADRRRHCPATSQRFVIDDETNAPVWSATVEGGYSELGLSGAIIAIHFGTHPQGWYEYFAVRRDHCDDGTFTETLPRLRFRIALKPQVTEQSK